MIILNPGRYISTDKWRLGNLYLEYDDIHDPLRFTIDTILKEAKEESRLVKQILYSMLSAYTNYPINLAINSPSDEGKTYVLQKVGELFPKQDAMFLAGMTEKALFHRAGEDQPRTDSKQAPEPEVLTMTDSSSNNVLNLSNQKGPTKICNSSYGYQTELVAVWSDHVSTDFSGFLRRLDHDECSCCSRHLEEQTRGRKEQV